MLLMMPLWGCSSSDDSAGPVSCSAALPGAGGGAAAPAVCVDVVGGTEQDVANNRQQCAEQGGTFALALCPHTGASGGCRTSQGAAQITTWYYADTTADDTRALCEGLARFAPNGVTIEFVSP
jgi:hypothetical protein